ncbi:TlpA disulfide reductase family protein [Aquimarina gracilis]|uniref:TlpA disulfide reductase family protein n=1 Tax=Aquimarina gracilis TaxID=874422 RepID=A0ABU6A2D9_9FLAO|nr:TlpA disulfide reductase family protein [Aquimarina gracilis]MEB3348342.1 TlpA disulfide reductase family protein [Aquimarina gracilis]
MKRIALLAIIMLIASCQKEETGYIISADAAGFDDGTEVYINAISQSNRPVVIDTAVIKQEKFEIKLPPPEGHDFNYLTFKNVRGNVLYLAENNPIKITIYKDSLRSSVVKGGSENELFFGYIKKIRAFSDEKIKLNTQYQIAAKLNEAEKIAKIAIQQQEINEKEKEYRTEIAEKNVNSLVGLIALGDLMNMKILTPKDAKEKYDILSDELKSSRIGKDLNARINNAIASASQKRIDIGSEAQDFSGPTPDGKTLSLKESMGKVTIIDFWASWCKPCRMENPNVVRVYNKYHDKGLNIIGVSLDKKQEAWVKAIADDKLEWNHVSNLQFWQDPIARAYGVRSIPATFILDEKGNVIAKNLRGPALEKKISELLGGSL